MNWRHWHFKKCQEMIFKKDLHNRTQRQTKLKYETNIKSLMIINFTNMMLTDFQLVFQFIFCAHLVFRIYRVCFNTKNVQYFFYFRGTEVFQVWMEDNIIYLNIFIKFISGLQSRESFELMWIPFSLQQLAGYSCFRKSALINTKIVISNKL